jgi:hypothetical protein
MIPPAGRETMEWFDQIKPHVLTIWRKLVQHPLIIAATVLALIAIYLALADRVAAGSLVAALFVIVALFHYLPQMESFKAYGVEAKWRARINEADDILRKLRQSTLASAELTYHTLGWGSRMGGQRAKMKQGLADRVDAALIDLGVDREQVMELKREYLFFASFDLFHAFKQVVDWNLMTNDRKATRRLDELHQDQTNPEVQELTIKLSKLRESRPALNPLEDLSKVNFRDYCRALIPTAALPAREAKILTEFADKVADMVGTCKRTGRVIDGAAELIDGYQPEDRKALYRQLFNEEPIL